jgi:hypothetical protein
VNYEFGRRCKEMVMAYFKVPFLKMPGGSKKNHYNFNENGQSLGYDSNLGPCKYEAKPFRGTINVWLLSIIRTSINWGGGGTQ